MQKKFLEQMADYIESVSYERLGSEIIEISKLAIIDTIAVALAGWNEPSVEVIKKTYMKKSTTNVMASIWGELEKVPLEYAALINGTATHALDFDDVTPTILAHPSAPLVASIFTLGEYLEKSMKDILAAYVVGTEVMITLGKVMGFKHYDLGWHSTSTLGTIGATAASGLLMGFNKETLQNAIAISASMAGGLQKNFGTMTKPLHVGLAAQHAIQAVLLAEEGLTANKEIFEERGFFQAYTGSDSFVHLSKNIQGTTFGGQHDYEVNGLSVKKFPCCYLTHRFIDGMLEIRKENNLTLSDVVEINVSVPPNGLTALIHHQPITGLQGKFSAEYTCLAALEDGEIQLNSFTDSMVQRDKIQKLFGIVQLSEYEGEITDSEEIEKLPVYVSVKTKEGEVIEKEVKHAPGSKGKPMNLEEYEAKWFDCLTFAYGDEVDSKQKSKMEHLFQQGLEMEKLHSVREWIENIKGFMNESKEEHVV
ncbi:MmgE/PrpD family protein [Psychrobacillus sp. NEAU-3TGS]|uniref:MmgE/PrpD family protein n=1 Tax=Psychrobacillus sp. NEAU-3TGS TaxID=2995412 RepID=UPI0024967B81|nr:MmgE/PrpD family protein [Psychrobacillus sp. NEAU-3TGS]MDI2587566.1 MmgE/PrpD family protein [Psychrobacillus sp. NEAU-3TGS]